MALLTEEMLGWIGRSEPPITVTVARRDIQKYSTATEQQLDRYLSGDEAPPMFVFNFFSEIPLMSQLRPDGLARGSVPGPKLPLKRRMAGGTRIEMHRPIRAGDTLTATRTLVDLYEKEGRTGPLIFTEYVTRIVDDEGQPVLDEHLTGIAR